MRAVLLLEPHTATRDHLRLALTEAGFRVFCVEDPERALEQLAAEQPDAIVLAVDLPKVGGTGFGKLVRATPAGARLPMVAVDKGHLGKARGVSAILDLQVNAYVPDATRTGELVARLEQLLAAAQTAPRPTKGISATLACRPVAAGDVAGLNLAQTAHSCFRLKRDGILVIAQRDLTRRIFYVQGIPTNYDSSARGDALESWLLEENVIDAATHAAMLRCMQEDGLSPGAALVAIGALEAGEALLGKLREYARAKIAEALAMSSGRFSFHPGDEFRSEVPSLDLPALAPIYEAARGHWPVKRFASALSPFMKSWPIRTAAFSQDLPMLGLGTAELKLALAIDGRHTARELLAKVDLRLGYALLWFLHTAGAIRFANEPSESATPAAFAAAENAARLRSRRKPLPEEKLKELREDAVRILTGSYFGAMGLDISADDEDVERAYHATASRFHPDSYPENDLGDVEDLLASVQDKLGAAYRVLCEGEKRRAYVNFLLSRVDTPRANAPVVNAEIALKRGEKLMKKGDLRGALVAFEEAVSLNAREPEYYSYLAWATFKAGAGSEAERARAAMKLLRKALSMNPTLERPQIIQAIVEDELGDPAEARRILLRVLKANPASELARKTLQGLSRRRGAKAHA